MSDTFLCQIVGRCGGGGVGGRGQRRAGGRGGVVKQNALKGNLSRLFKMEKLFLGYSLVII